MSIIVNATFKITSLEQLNGLVKYVEDRVMEKPNLTKIAREMGVSRETARKYYNGFEKKKRKVRSSKVDKHKDYILELLEHEHKQFDYKSHLYRYIKNHKSDLDYSEGTFSRYINKYFKDKFKSNEKKASIRFENEAGEQAQFDYKENQTYIDSHGEEHIVNIAALTFSYSRFTFRSIIPDKTTRSTIEFLASVFEKVGGVPKTIVFDNGPSLVAKVRSKQYPGDLVLELDQFSKDYGIETYICMPYHPQTKGKVENKMKTVDELKGYGGDFKDLVELDNILQNITDRENESNNQATDVPDKLLFQKEKELLNHLPSAQIRSNYFLNLKPVIANSNALVSFKSKQYSVPAEYIGLHIQRKQVGDKLHLYYNQKFLFTHIISHKKINYDPSHLKQLKKKAYKSDDHGLSTPDLSGVDETVNVLEMIHYA